MTPRDLGARLRTTLVAHAGRLGLRPEDVTVEPVLNWGGFVNRSFHVTDGRLRLHVKLASTPETLPGLRRWSALAAYLSERYGAPRVLAWLDVQGTPWSGPAFEWIAGHVPRRLGPSVVEGVSDAVARLHADDALATRLKAMGDRVRSCREMYLETYHDRFTEDLKGIRTAPPPFVAEGDLAWMQAEAAVLANAVRASAAFDEPAGRPTHGDLWLHNLLVAPDGRVHVLDWDGLALGDPVADWVTLYGPTRTDLSPASSGDAHARGLDPAARARFDVYARASLLDWVIDPLADWVEAEHVPEHRDAVRRANEEVHRRARSRYRERFGGGSG